MFNDQCMNCLFVLQIDQKPHLQRINHHENHVSQITKTIQSQANHTNHSQPHNHSNHVISEHENHVPISRVPNHVSAVNQANHQKNLQNQRLSPSQEWRQPDDNVRLQEDSIYESGPVVSNDGKHSLLQYAMLNFRQSTEKWVNIPDIIYAAYMFVKKWRMILEKSKSIQSQNIGFI